jgi:hypothetical protein
MKKLQLLAGIAIMSAFALPAYATEQGGCDGWPADFIAKCRSILQPNVQKVDPVPQSEYSMPDPDQVVCNLANKYAGDGNAIQMGNYLYPTNRIQMRCNELSGNDPYPVRDSMNRLTQGRPFQCLMGLILPNGRLTDPDPIATCKVPPDQILGAMWFIAVKWSYATDSWVKNNCSLRVPHGIRCEYRLNKGDNPYWAEFF